MYGTTQAHGRQLDMIGAHGAGDRTPDSVVCRHLSLRTAEAIPGSPGATRPRRPGGDANKRGGTNALRLPPMSLPHAPCSPRPAQSPSRRHHCRRWSALTRPFHPSPVAWRACSLLPSCVTRSLHHTRPRLLFRGVALRSNAKVRMQHAKYFASCICSLHLSGRGVGKFLWIAPATAHRQRHFVF